MAWKGPSLLPASEHLPYPWMTLDQRDPRQMSFRPDHCVAYPRHVPNTGWLISTPESKALSLFKSFPFLVPYMAHSDFFFFNPELKGLHVSFWMKHGIIAQRKRMFQIFLVDFFIRQLQINVFSFLFPSIHPSKSSGGNLRSKHSDCSVWPSDWWWSTCRAKRRNPLTVHICSHLANLPNVDEPTISLHFTLYRRPAIFTTKS